jgi:hypothetical protein
MGFPEVFGFCAVMTSAAIYVIISPEYSDSMQWTSVNGYHIAASSTMLSSKILFALRLLAIVCHWWSILYIYLDRNGLNVTVLTREGTKKPLHLLHLERFSMFTVWCWTIQGIYFLLAGIHSYHYLYNQTSTIPLTLDPTSPLSIVTWVLFELSFASAFMVSATVTFVLIPGLKARNMPTTTFYTFFGLLFHNANIILIVMDAMLNSIPVNSMHVPFGMLYAMSYVAFSWYWFEKKGVFYYFFLDYAPNNAIFSYMALLTAV